MSCIAAVVVALTASLPSSSAFAGEPESKTLFAEGRKLREEKKCAEAIIVFRRALDTYPEGLGSLRNIAECEQELGLFASARRDWNDLRVAVLQSRSPKYEGWDKDAADAKAALDSRVGYVTIQITGDRPEGTRIQLNGKTFDPRLIGVPLEQDNGSLTLEVFYGAAQPLSKTTTIEEGSRATLSVEIPKGAVAKVGPPETPDNGRAATSRGMKIGGGVALGIGGLAAVGLGVSIGIRQDALATVEKACPDPKQICSAAADVERGRTASTLVNVFAVGAAVGVGLGLTLVLAAPSESAPAVAPDKKDDKPPSSKASLRPPPPRLQLDVRGTMGGGYVGLGGHF